MKSSCRGTTTRCSSPTLRPASANRQRHFITPTPSAVARRASSACKRTRATRSRGGIFGSSHSRQRPTRAGRVASLTLAGSASCVRAVITGQIEMHQREIERLRVDLVHVDATLRLFDPDTDPYDILPRRRLPKRTHYFDKGEQSRRVY